MNTTPTRPVERVVDRTWWNELGSVLVDLEHHDMTHDLDHRYQRVVADVAARVDAPDVWARLARAACTCHHCRPGDVDAAADDSSSPAP